MKRTFSLAAALIGVAACSTPTAQAPGPASPAAASDSSTTSAPAAVAWRRFGPEALAAARAERKIIVLSIGTTWCHWCHVMDDKTWGDPEVAALLATRFVPVRADADANPALKVRYEAWGWPATILLTPDAEPLGELKGFVAKEKLLPYLRSLLADLDAGTLRRRARPTADAPRLAVAEAITAAEAQLDAVYDPAIGGWGGPKKYPLRAPMQAAAYRAARFDDEQAGARLVQTADKLLRLCDPVWGGMYQYSTHNDWAHAHTEKLAQVQGTALTVFALAHRRTQDPRYGEAAAGVLSYLNTFMSDEGGGFFANQDADGGGHGADRVPGRTYYALDDAARRAAGVPYIDRHVYAAHNAYVLTGLADWVAATGDDAALARLVEGEAALFGLWTPAGFVHEAGGAGIFLEDQVAAAEAYEAMYAVTLDPVVHDRWLALVPVLTGLIDDERGGFRHQAAADAGPGVFGRAYIPLGLSARAARALLRAAELLDDERGAAVREQAGAVLDKLSTPPRLARLGRGVGEALLALYDRAYAPVHVSLVGPAPLAGGAMHRAALDAAPVGAVIEHVGPGGRFGAWDEPAVFICGRAYCSRPVTRPDDVAAVAAGFTTIERPR